MAEASPSSWSNCCAATQGSGARGRSSPSTACASGMPAASASRDVEHHAGGRAALRSRRRRALAHPGRFPLPRHRRGLWRNVQAQRAGLLTTITRPGQRGGPALTSGMPPRGACNGPRTAAWPEGAVHAGLAVMAFAAAVPCLRLIDATAMPSLLASVGGCLDHVPATNAV